MKIFTLLLLFSLNCHAEQTEQYGPMPKLNSLAPNYGQNYQQQLKLDYENWYQRFGRDLSSENQYEWSIRPHNEVTESLKDKAINGGLKIDQTIKGFRPNELQGELIIRY